MCPWLLVMLNSLGWGGELDSAFKSHTIFECKTSRADTPKCQRGHFGRNQLRILCGDSRHSLPGPSFSIPPRIKQADGDDNGHQGNKQMLHGPVINFAVQGAAYDTAANSAGYHQNKYVPTERRHIVG